MPTTRARSTEADKTAAVRAVVVGKLSLRPVAREYGVSHITLRRWVLATRLARPGAAEGPRCDVCGKAPKLPRVDHCAKTGEPRGTLCQLCTIALAAVNEDPTRAEALAVYARACAAFGARTTAG